MLLILRERSQQRRHSVARPRTLARDSSPTTRTFRNHVTTHAQRTMPSVHWPGPIVLPGDFDDADAPDALVCPITQCLMTEPALVVSSGRTYERAAIVRWIQQHGVDPLDRGNALRVDQLAPNLAVRQMVETWARERCGGVLPTQDVRGGTATVATPPPSIAALVDADRPTQEPNPAPAERTNASLATRPFAGEDDPIVDGAITVLGHYRAPARRRRRMASSSSSRPRGWRRCCADAGGRRTASSRTPAATSRTEPAPPRLLRTRERARRAGASCGAPAADPPGSGVGCWNPAEYSEPGSFRRGDVLVLPDFVGRTCRRLGPRLGRAGSSNRVVEKVLTPARVTKKSGTGGTSPGTRSRSGGAASSGTGGGNCR